MGVSQVNACVGSAVCRHSRGVTSVVTLAIGSFNTRLALSVWDELGQIMFSVSNYASRSCLASRERERERKREKEKGGGEGRDGRRGDGKQNIL